MQEETEPANVVQKKDPSNKDKVRLKLIYVTGKTHEFYFTPEDSAATIGKYVFENWPEAKLEKFNSIFSNKIGKGVINILMKKRTPRRESWSRNEALAIDNICYEFILNAGEEWADDKVDNHKILRLIYQGRFLHGNVTLGAINLPVGKLTVMHLVPREKLPEASNQSESNREKSEEGRCMQCCVIL